MGQSVSAVRDAAQAQNEELEKTATDSLTALQDLARLQMQLFDERVKSNTDSAMIGISKVLRSDVIVKCGVASDGMKIAQEVTDSYNAFADGDIAKGIGSVLSAGLDALFGSSTAQSNTVDKYFVTVGKLGYPYRVDLRLYTYSFTSATLIAVTKNVVAIAIVISSVDITKIDEDTLGALVQLCYGSADDTVQQNILDKLLAIKAGHPLKPAAGPSVPAGPAVPSRMVGGNGGDSRAAADDRVVEQFDAAMKAQESLGGPNRL